MKYELYLGLPYKHQGRSKDGIDCFGLIRLVYKEQYNIDVSDCVGYAQNWWEDTPSVVSSKAESYGFREVFTPKTGDLVLLYQHGIPRHLGIVVDDGMYVLHTTKGGVSCQPLNYGYWSQRIHSFYRHRSKYDSQI